MSSLARRLEVKERLQDLRIKRVEAHKAALDTVIAEKQREIDNLRAQVTAEKEARPLKVAN